MTTNMTHDQVMTVRSMRKMGWKAIKAEAVAPHIQKSVATVEWKAEGIAFTAFILINGELVDIKAR
jgi:hypothetical protein